MSKTTWVISAIIGAAGLTGYLTSYNLNILNNSDGESSVAPSQTVAQAIETLTVSSHDIDFTTLSNDTLTPEQQALLAHPNVKAYLAREQQKATLKQYFEQPSGHDPEKIYQLIESIENEGRLLGFEALNLKLAWLELNSANEDDFKQASQKLIESYKQKAEKAALNYAPESIKGYTKYKEMESAIVKEVMAMDSFPEGHSRQSYLRDRLLNARVMAYGSP